MFIFSRTEIRYCSHSQAEKILLLSDNKILATQCRAEKRKQLYALFIRSTSMSSLDSGH